jgi:RNA polymerase primary sigma factor
MLRNGEVKTVARAHLYVIVDIAFIFGDEVMHFLDIVNEGNIGLMKAIENYDLNSNTSFIPFVKMWAHICIYIEMMDRIQLKNVPYQAPLIISRMKKFNQKVDGLKNSLGRTPTYKEISIHTGYSEEMVKNTMEYMNKTPEELKKEQKEKEKIKIVKFLNELDLPERNEMILQNFCGIGTNQLSENTIAHLLSISPDEVLENLDTLQRKLRYNIYIKSRE